MTVHERVRALREAFGFTQAELARQTHGALDAAYIYKLETGRNKARSHRVRTALATAFRLPLADIDAYLEGRLPLEQVRARAAHAPEPSRAPAAPAPYGPSDEPTSALEAALVEAFDKTRHTLRDLDAVRAVMRESHFMLKEDGDLVTTARSWLDAAAGLRRDGLAATSTALLVRLTHGRGAHAQAIAAEVDARTAADHAAAARARGYDPGSKRHLGEQFAARIAKKRRGRGGE